MIKRLDQKPGRIRAGKDPRRDFLIANAKDADMACGIPAPGPYRAGVCPHRHDPAITGTTPGYP